MDTCGIYQIAYNKTTLIMRLHFTIGEKTALVFASITHKIPNMLHERVVSDEDK